MKQRVITSIMITLGMIAVLFTSFTVAYPIVLAILAFIATYEVLRVFALHKRLFVAIPSYLVAVSMPVTAYVMTEAMGRAPLDFVHVISLVIFSFMLYLFVVAVFERGRMPFGEFSSAFAMVTYVVASFSAISLIRYFEDIGLYCLGMILISAWITEVFAYLVGTFFGKHKLIPEVSPKKTVEGSVGGIVFATLAMMLYGLLVYWFTRWIPGATPLNPNYLVLGISGAVLSVVSQIGDLFASVIKREHGVKDYGWIFPGHGGIMDRFDSILIVSTATMVICFFVAPFTPVA